MSVHQITGNISCDIDTVYEASCQMRGLLERLMEHAIAKNYDVSVFVNMQTASRLARQLQSECQQMLWADQRLRGE